MRYAVPFEIKFSPRGVVTFAFQPCEILCLVHVQGKVNMQSHYTPIQEVHASLCHLPSNCFLVQLSALTDTCPSVPISTQPATPANEQMPSNDQSPAATIPAITSGCSCHSCSGDTITANWGQQRRCSRYAASEG
ncbi:hypothetical protein VOLCADRAFT_106998 [Volvox carteri f. nagariensis]|uniref:Uncharacterized protein n=1 Tax=Volvox carteri f. nagariensis TaxID=3068 RepID=D8UBH8_VOLCA|nr:uncharacterized protein VOLCADRAFT_106998 [Volvox carteri f. nagariensis]EFJ42889.1 hypothetical protein VOLCADRAFT_106998 [Volvox carteri f. nagariensis]|eukprot:XP_002955929.1 hypothetical protein VOLCADRAFT_106998 [Volvox carteri f. nagariensis]